MNGQWSKKLPLSFFKWVDEICKFNEDFIKNCDD